MSFRSTQSSLKQLLRYLALLLVLIGTQVATVLFVQNSVFLQQYAAMSVVVEGDEGDNTFMASLERAQQQPRVKIGAVTEGPSWATHLVVVADDHFARRYQPIFERMEVYAKRHGYTWTILNVANLQKRFPSQAATLSDCVLHTNFFFLKHCLVASWMELEDFPEEDAVFVMDSDVVPYRQQLGLERWTKPLSIDGRKSLASIMLYVRGKHIGGSLGFEEITAGNYMVRNTFVARAFLRSWAQYETLQPPGFSSADNGALHIHLLRFLGLEEVRDNSPKSCWARYKNLTAPVTDLNPYFEYVKCARSKLPGNHTFVRGNFVLQLAEQSDSFADDWGQERAPQDVVDNVPVFHHGIKIGRLGEVTEAHKNVLSRYKIALPSSPNQPPQPPHVATINCGQHQASSCGECPQGHGEKWCNGDCHWCSNIVSEAGISLISVENEATLCVALERACQT